MEHYFQYTLIAIVDIVICLTVFYKVERSERLSTSFTITVALLVQILLIVSKALGLAPTTISYGPLILTLVFAMMVSVIVAKLFPHRMKPGQFRKRIRPKIRG